MITLLEGLKEKVGESRRKNKELEEAREAGTATAEVDEEGRYVNEFCFEFQLIFV